MNKKGLDKRQILELVSKGELTSQDAHALIKEINKENEIAEVLYYGLNWEKSNIPNTNQDNRAYNFLIFTEKSAKHDHYKNAILIYQGKTFKKINNTTYEIAPQNKEDYLSLFLELMDLNMPPTTIIDLWSSKMMCDNVLNFNDIEALFNRSITHVFHIIKTIHVLKIKSINKMVSVICHKEEMVNPFVFALKGFTGSLNKMMPKFSYSTLSLPVDVLKTDQVMTIIKNELSIHTKYMHQDILYDKSERYVRQIVEIAQGMDTELYNEEDINQPINIKQEGVYLITGGLGGLGLVLAKHLMSKYQAKLYLTGRGKLSDEKRKILSDISEMGGEVTYFQANVGNRNEMEDVINRIKQKHHSLNGVIHMAGLPGSMVFNKKEIESFRETLFPKVEGSIILDDVTKDENIDFMLFFSSASSIMGDFGQVDYSVSNRFLDGYAQYREHLRQEGLRKGYTKVINWPLWRDGGMHLDSKAEELYLKTSGMTYLENEEGMSVFEKVMNSHLSQAIIFVGKKEKIQGFINHDNKGKRVEVEEGSRERINKESFVSFAPRSLSIDKKVEFDIKKIVSQVIKLPSDKLNINDNLGIFGFDSISLTELGDKIGMFYGIEISPTIFFAQSDIKGLCNYMLTEFKDEVNNRYLSQNNELNINSSHENKSFSKDIIDTSNTSARSKILSSSLQNRLSKFQKEDKKKEGIAIIGMSGIYPGSKNLDEFWRNLEEERDLITEIPPDRWDWREFYSEDPSQPNKTTIKWGGFIEDVDKFDSEFFNISPREAELMDPQQRIFLQTTWKAIEDSGYKSSELSGRNVGVFVGVQFTDYQDIMEKGIEIQAQMGTGNAHALLCNRISYLLNLKGPSESIDTACSSALVAIHRAVKSIQSGESELAIAGGVSLIISPYMHLGAARLGVLSPDGRCKTFDKGANGYVRGEGVGAIFLKPLSKAVEDGDHIYAVIKASAEGHGGKASSLTAPNSDAQAALLVKAYEEAGFQPDTISYIETHGTGTALGDPTEIDGLKKGFADLAKKQGQESTKFNYCGIGSVKTNVGHLEPASGIAGLTKLVLALNHKKLPGLLHFKEINPYINLENTPFYIVKDTIEWIPLRDTEGNILPRRTGVSSFGFGGTYAHIVLEEFVDNKNHNSDSEFDNSEAKLFVLSAKNKETLKVYASELAEFISNHEDIKLYDIAYTLQIGRSPMNERLAIVAIDKNELISSLQAYIDENQKKENIFTANVKESTSKYHLFVQDERGNQFIKDMIRDKKLEVIAELYVNGIDIDWNELYPISRPKRISLPTYPFVKDRYWLPKIKAKNASSTTLERCQITYYTKGWEKSDTIQHYNKLTGNILLFDTHDTQKEQLELSFKEQASVILIKPSDTFRKIKDDCYEINPVSQGDYVSLLNELKGKGIQLDKVAYLWSLLSAEHIDLKTGSEFSLERVEDHLDRGIKPIYYLFKAMVDTKTKSIKRIVVPYLVEKEFASPFCEAINGYARSILQVWPKLALTTVQIDTEAFQDEIVSKVLINELMLPVDSIKPEAKYVRNSRFIRKMEEVKLVDQMINNESEDYQLKKNGVYLITGGMGALGMITAKYLAENYSAKLVLIGRSQLNKEKNEILDVLKAIGGEAIYLCGDVGNLEDMKAVVKAAKERFGYLNGVFHIAGSAGPNLITKKDDLEFKQVLTPKVQGTLAIDEATKNEALDLFIMYSSASAIMGDFGQCDYAVSNRFLDSYLQYREMLRKYNKRNGRTISINWPTWREGGMHLNQESESLYLKSSGMVYLETMDAVKALEEIIRSRFSQVLVMAGERNRVDRFLHEGKEEEKSKTLLVGSRGKLLISEKIELDLIEIASSILKVDQQKLKVTENLGEYGFDSLSLKELGNEIGHLYQIEMPPTVFFEYSTLEGLRKFILEEFGDEVKAFYESSSNTDPAIPFDYTEDIINSQNGMSIKESHTSNTQHKNSDEPIAIIGVSGIYPGSKDLEEFWYNLENEKDLITEIPPDRWDWRAFYSEDPTEPNKTKIKWGGFIDDVDKFDAGFFNISPREAELMDPQQRLFLQTTWKAIEDSGYKPSEFWGRNIGVFVGMQFDDYLDMMGDSTAIQAQTGTGNAHALLCNRISYLLNLKGPSESIDTACSSALVAVHRAVKSIQSGESELAIAGGVSLMLSPYTYIGAAKLGILSPDGRCKTFDKRANGYVKGEGIGSILLKPLNKAIEDNNHIYAVIKGTAESHGGRANSLTAPNAEAQAAMLVKAYEEAGFDPETISYIEAHGTGTELGDPTEIQGLKKAFNQLAEKKGHSISKTNYCGIGSVKTNIGHLEPASGMAGLTKLIFALKHKKLPGTVHLNELNPYIQLENTPFYIINKTQEWEPLQDINGTDIPRRAGVSSFGFGGTYAHVVVEEYKPSSRNKGNDNHVTEDTTFEPHIIILSAKNEERLKENVSKMAQFIDKQIESGKSRLNLSELAYTLQVGREAMDARLAIIVNSLEMVREKLNIYLSNDKNHENIYFGLLTEENQKFKTKARLEQQKEEVQSFIQLKAYEKLAMVWVSGYDVDWKHLYKGNRIRRVSLPTYAFANDRYWVSKAIEKGDTQGKLKKLHPMIDWNTSTLEVQSFTTLLNGNEFYLCDHEIEGNKLLPGVVYIEMARAAAEISGLKSVHQLKDVLWTRPIISDKRLQEVHISLNPESNGIVYEISTMNENEEAIIHGQGRLLLENSVSLNTKVDLEAIKARCTKQLSASECYNAFNVIGFNYGRSFQAIENLYVGEGEVLASLELPKHLIDNFSEFGFHPSILDGALQAILGFGNGESNGIYVPFALGEIELVKPLKESCYSHVTINTDSIKIRKFNVVITDEEGEVLAKIKDFSLRALINQEQETTNKKEGQSNIALSLRKSETFFYHYETENKELVNQSIKMTSSNSILVLYDDEGIVTAFKDILTEGSSQMTFVKSSAAFNQIDNHHYEINVRKKEDYSNLIDLLKVQGQMPSHIIYALNINGKAVYEDDYLDTTAYALSYLSSTLIEQKPNNNLSIILAYQTGHDKILPGVKAGGALLKTVVSESSKITYKTIGFDNSELKKAARIIYTELESEDRDILYKNDKRYVNQLKEITNTTLTASTNKNVIRHAGVYMITGGTGGLGLLFAEYLVKHYHASIILTGRAELDAVKRAKIQALNTYDTEVLYIQGDISKQEDVQRIISETKTRFNQINGIIHSAGKIKDALLINKKEGDIKDVIAPKVYGTYWLDEATKDEELDFFVMFSSVSSIFGNAGQADYAYANSYMDHYAVYRSQLQKEGKRYGKSLSINWPLWQDGGMKPNNEMIKLLEHNYGMTLIDTAKGIQAFELSLLSSEPQVIVIEGFRDRQFHLNKDISPFSENPEDEALEVDTKALLKRLKKDLQIIMAKILKINPSEININTDLNKYGFDSITFTEFSNQLNEKYKLHVMPSIFYEHSTLLSFINYLGEEYKDVLAVYYNDGLKVIPVKDEAINVEPLLTNTGIFNSRFNNLVNLQQNSQKKAIDNEPIAIIGMSGVMPESSDLDQFWHNLESGKDLITEVPKDRWDWKAVYGNPMKEVNKTNVKWGGFMPDVDKFDAQFFGISPREAELMDPQQRIFLETVYKTIEDAGYSTKTLSGTKTGVFVGVGTSDYSDLLKQGNVEIQAQTTTGMAHCVLVNRISYLLNLHGPSEPIDTACSSSLTAIHRAVEAIQLGNCEMAIAGGVNVIATPTLYISLSKAGMLCEDGRCKTFDKDANGYVRGEGAGALLLKPLSKAVEDGDHIYALIKGSDVNHGGQVNSLTTPNPNAQADVIIRAWQKAAIDPSTINYIEAHGTGTSLGDPIEINGLKKAFSHLFKEWEKTPSEAFCGIGSVKTNIGHLEPGAGIASVLKVLLAMKYKKIPANIHLNTINPYIQLENSPFYIVDRTIEWRTHHNEPRRAGVSSFGFGGTNAHIVLEEYKETSPINSDIEEPQIFVLSAKNESRLRAYAQKMLDYINARWFKTGEALSEKELIKKLNKILQILASQIVNVPMNEISILEGIDEYGFDPVSLDQLVTRINERFGINDSLKTTGYSSLEAISNYLLENHRIKVQNYFKEENLMDLPPSNLNQYLSLSDLVYTLQVGRDAMTERLAIVAESIEIVKDKLTQYLSGNKDIEHLYLGTVNSKQKTPNLFDGEEGREIIHMLMSKKKYHKLAVLWTSGTDVNWKQLYRDKRVRRLSLPTYPFARDSFWISDIKNHLDVQIGREEISQLHPIIHKNTSTLDEQKFTTLLSGNEFFMADHIVAGKKVLPGVTYIEMAKKAGELSGIKEVSIIKNLIWARPITFEIGYKELQISLFPEKDMVEFEVYSVDDNKEVILHSQGKLIESRVLNKNIFDDLKINLEAIKANCSKVVSGDECYKSFKEKKLEYGKSFQTIKHLYCGESEALAYLELPDSLKDDFNKFSIHPSLMDGALQAVSGMGNDNKDFDTYLPFALSEITFIEPLKDKCYAHVIYVGGSSQIKKFNITIVDEQGHVLILMKELSLKALGNQNEGISTMYYTSEWIVNELKKDEGEGSVKKILVIDSNVDRYHHMTSYGNHVILATAGTRFKKISETQYEININEQEDYLKLLSDLKENHQMPAAIMHLYNCEEKKPERTESIFRNEDEFISEEGFNQQLLVSVYSIYHLSRALIALKPKGVIRLVYAYHASEEEFISHHEAVSGLLKTVNLENSKVLCKCMGLSNMNTTETVKALLQEINNDRAEVIYNKGVRHIKVLNEIKPLFEETNNHSLIKDKGVYVITGGAGGLGLIFATYLAKKYEAKLVLTGRSELDAYRKAKIEQLKAYGSEVLYIQTDVTNKEEVTKLISKTKSVFKEINGIIHSAGITRDAYLVKKTLKEMEQVLAPKLFGTLNLDSATKDERLDFFMMFSSVSGVRGNIGQADYAYANSFMDSFACTREQLRQQGKRNGKAISINWPLWQDGGMKVDSDTEKLLRNNFGMTLLQTETGIQVFEYSLIQEKPQLMVVEGVKSKMIANISRNETMAYTMTDVQKTSAIVIQDRTEMSADKLLLNVQAGLKEIVSRILKLKEQDIDLEVDMSEFGFDSISFTEFGNQLNDQYGLEIMPNVFYEHSELRSLSEFLLEEYKDKLSQYYGFSSLKNKADINQKDQLIKEMSSSITEQPQLDLLELPKSQAKRSRLMISNDLVTKQPSGDDIAIIGLSGRYPKAKNIVEFWDNLKNSEDCITEIPVDRWDYHKYYHPNKNIFGTSNSKWGGFIDDVDKFDPLFFNISPRDAQFMDPQERIFLETVWHAAEDAGYTKSQLSKRKVGVYVGVMYGEYQLYGAEETLKGNPMSLTSSYASIANRVSYYFDLNGPSIALDTMCSSALTAIHLACESLYRGETDMAVAGGVNLTLHPNKYLMLSQGGFLASDGKCHSYGDGGDGYVPGEGAGVIILKPLCKAKEDGDYIYGVIKGIAANHGGRTSGYTVPNPKAQTDVILDALKKANIDPRTISYVEGQGTGTPIGDPIEIAALTKAYSQYTSDKQFCSIGSAKSNIGHLESAGGIAGITKVLLQMKYQQIVPSLHAETVNPSIKFKETPFYLQHELDEWKQIELEGKRYLRRAAINSFGAGGSNVHMIIEEYENKPCVKRHNEHIILLSARNAECLKVYAKTLANYLMSDINGNSNTTITLDNIAYTLQIGREAMNERLAVHVSSTNELISALNAFIEGNIDERKMFTGNIRKNNSDISLFLEGKEGEAYIRTIIQDRKLDKLARLWISGVHIDWRLLYGGESLTRVALPAYPFAKERYWVPRKESQATERVYNEEILHTKFDGQQNIEAEDSKATTLKMLTEIDSSIEAEALIAIDLEKTSHHQEDYKQLDNVKSSSYKDMYEEVIKKVRTFIAEVLGVNTQHIETDVSLYEYGLSSITMVQLVNRIQDEFDTIELTSSIFQQDSLEGFAQSIFSELQLKEINQPIVNTEVLEKPDDTFEVDTTEPVAVEQSQSTHKFTDNKMDGSKLKTKNILINGVTGVLGGRLIKEYLELTNSVLYCIVRSDDNQQAKKRIKDMLDVHDPNQALNEQLEKRVIPIIGDITKPMIGLKKDVYKELADTIDMVVHVAAKTSLHGFYNELKSVNVDGTRHMIEFALNTQQKYLIHTSTIAIMGDRQHKNCVPFTEKDFDLGQRFEKMGYEQSKFEAEYLVRSAGDKGLKWIIIRSGYIMGDSQNGYYPFGITSVPGIFYDFIKTAVEMKVFYNSPFHYDITPLDYISKGMVYLTTTLKDIGQTYHLNNPSISTLNDVMSYINKYGYQVDIINYDEFIDILQGKENAYNSLTTELIRLKPLDKESSLGYSYADASYTKHTLEKGNIHCPKVDDKLIRTYLDYCIQAGYIKKPKKPRKPRG